MDFAFLVIMLAFGVWVSSKILPPPAKRCPTCKGTGEVISKIYSGDKVIAEESVICPTCLSEGEI